MFDFAPDDEFVFEAPDPAELGNVERLVCRLDCRSGIFFVGDQAFNWLSVVLSEEVNHDGDRVLCVQAQSGDSIHRFPCSKVRFFGWPDWIAARLMLDGAVYPALDHSPKFSMPWLNR